MSSQLSSRYAKGDIVPFHMSAGIIVASSTSAPDHTTTTQLTVIAIPCLAGCITTVELLHRKSSIRGWLNWYVAECVTPARGRNSHPPRVYQLGIAVSFGLVGIWCMHYTGNRAISKLPNSYDAGSDSDCCSSFRRSSRVPALLLSWVSCHGTTPSLKALHFIDEALHSSHITSVSFLVPAC